MALMLPGWLRTALEYIGYDWPATNEDVLNRWADDFSTLSGDAAASLLALQQAVTHVHNENEGPGIQAFIDQMNSPDSNLDALENFKTACDLAGTGCTICAGIVVAMKGAVIFQLGLLAAALGTGPGVLLVKQGVKWAIEFAINLAVDKILAGGA